MEQSAHRVDRKNKSSNSRREKKEIQVTQMRIKVRNAVKTLQGFYQTKKIKQKQNWRNQGRYTYSVTNNDINNVRRGRIHVQHDA